jgi:hypothetical protein
MLNAHNGLDRYENSFLCTSVFSMYVGEIKDIKILRDAYIAEIFVNGGEEIYTVLL